MTTEYTTNFRLSLPDFRMGPWHDLVNENTITIDQLLLSILQGTDAQIWVNSTPFLAGTTCVDIVDYTYWVCLVTHTSGPTPITFAQDRALHPTYWARVVVGVAPRGVWTNSTHYFVNDMVTDPIQGIIALCKQEHTSSALPANIRTDAVYWSFIADLTSTVRASGVTYDNTTSGVAATNVQTALDLGFATDVTQNSTLSSHTASIAAINGAGYISDAPADSKVYGRVNHTWTDIKSTALIADTPPAGAADNQMWWESDTGNLYIRFNDGNSTQWVATAPQIIVA